MDDLNELQAKMSKFAVDIADEFNIRLDYSTRSIKKVEVILSQIHAEFVKSNNDEGLNGIALEFAFYIITVIEKNFEKGKIERDHKDFGKNTFPFYWRSKTLFPYSWCLKRIYDGEGDNVWVKYKTLVLDEKEKKKIFEIFKRMTE